MNQSRIHAALVTALGLLLTPVAQAASTYTAQFNTVSMPLLRTGIEGFDGPGMLNGQWAPSKTGSAEAHTRDLAGTAVDPATGATVPVWGAIEGAANDHSTNGSPLSFGTGHARVIGPPWTHTKASATRAERYLGASAELSDVPATANAWASWNQDFWIDPSTSFTFSGIATLAITGDVAPLDAATSFAGGGDASFASLTYADALGRARVSIGATLFNLASGLQGVYDYSVGPNGLLSLTVTNTGTTRLFGNLSAGSYLDVNTTGLALAAPVPEPSTWLMLLGGVALVGGVARRGASRQPRHAV